MRSNFAVKLNYQFIGWCKEDSHDKVWVILQLGGDSFSGKFLVVWGRRGRKLQTKIHEYMSQNSVDSLIRSKENKGYQEIDRKNLDSIYPDFQEDLEKTAVWAMLTS